MVLSGIVHVRPETRQVEEHDPVEALIVPLAPIPPCQPSRHGIEQARTTTHEKILDTKYHPRHQSPLGL
ncbi:hypothetical protein E6H19_06310 [Candidatus Bathyarchaeota archaeon]|nr:MAG: hypothetical protein E6H19_06310 [Candidatus Bathyarchaeota archaeon]